MNWIRIEEKKPEPFVSVLGVMKNAFPFPEVRECYTVGVAGMEHSNVAFFPALAESKEITHWAPMPEPPKEDER